MLIDRGRLMVASEGSTPSFARMTFLTSYVERRRMRPEARLTWPRSHLIINRFM